MRPSTSTAPLTVVAGCGKTYPLPRNRASGDSQSGTACSGGAPPPNESRHPMAWPPASTAPLQAAELSQAFPRWTASPRPIAAGSPPSPSAKVRAGESRSNQPAQRTPEGFPVFRSTPYRSQRPCPALGSLAATNQASWNAPALTAAQRGELSASASTGPALRRCLKAVNPPGASPGACLTWTPCTVDCDPRFSGTLEGANALPFRQRIAVLGDSDPVRFRVAAGRAFPPAERSHAGKVDDLRVRREAHRPGLVQFQSALLPDRPGVRDLRGGDRVHVPRRVGLQVLHREGPGAARVRRGLRVRGEPRRGPRLRLGDGGFGMGKGPEAGRAAVAARQAAEAHRTFREEGGLAGCRKTTSKTSFIDEIINLARKSSIFYLLFGLACCGIELMQTGGPRADIDRFGSVPRATPRQSDLMIVAGTLTYKMAERCRLLYEQMAEPKYVISMGSCASCGGLFQYAYSVCKGVDKLVPVDIYVPGCPPRPEALTEGLMRVQDKIVRERWFSARQKIGQPEASLGVDYKVTA